MPIDNPVSPEYNFDRSYNSLPEIVVPIVVRNASFFDNDPPVLSAYANPIDKLLIFPEFETGFNGMTATDIADDYRYFIDLGDGTISDDLTAQHFYSNPGDYRLTFVAVDSASNFYKSIHQPIIRVTNAIEDTIFLTSTNPLTTSRSSFDTPIIINRFNSYHTWKSVSANGGYTINLTVSGNRSPFLNEQAYAADQDAHLKTFSTFASATQTGFKVATKIQTTNTFLYGRRLRTNPSQGLEITGFPLPGSVFIGTSGIAEVYYYED